MESSRSVAHLQEQLRTVILFELLIVPMFFFADYSVNPSDVKGIQAKDVLRKVLEQHIFRICVASNLLRSVGGMPKLYEMFRRDMGSPIYASFPVLPSGGPRGARGPGPAQLPLELHLRKADLNQIKVLCEIERSEDADVPTSPDNYYMTARFYRDIQQSLETLSEQQQLFDSDSDAFQLTTRDGVHSNVASDSIILVQTLQDALKACNILRKQVYQSVETEPTPYSELLSLQHHVPNTYNVVKDPDTKHLAEANPKLYLASRLFDACYCFSLICLEQTFQVSALTDADTRASLIANYADFMTKVLPRVALFLIAQPVKPEDPKINWAPGFNIFDFHENSPGTMPLQQIRDLAVEVVAAYGSAVSPLLADLPELLSKFAELPFMAPDVFQT